MLFPVAQISDIAAGGWHSAALTVRGEVYIWGRGEYGRLGISDRTGSSKLRPQKVRGLEGHRIVQVRATEGRAVTGPLEGYNRHNQGCSRLRQAAPAEGPWPHGTPYCAGASKGGGCCRHSRV